MIKRIIEMVIVVIVFTVLTAFSFWKLLPNGSVNKVQNETAILNDYISKTGKEIIRCIKEDDREGLNILFCEKARNSNYLKKKIDIVFDFIKENKIVFKNEIWSSPYSHGSTGYSGKTVEWVSCECKNVFINNKEYILNFNASEVLKGHPEYEGVLHIYFSELIDNDKLKGRMIKRNDNGYLGIDLVDINYDDCIWENIVPKEFDKNELYIIPDDLEEGRSNW